MAAVEARGQAVVGHQVDQRPVAEPVAEACLFERVRRVRHRLHTAGDHDLDVAGPDHRVGDLDCPDRGGADLVDRVGGNLDREAGPDGGLARRSLARAALEYLTHDHVLDLIRLEADPLESGLDRLRAELRRFVVLQPAAEPAKGRPDGGNDHRTCLWARVTTGPPQPAGPANRSRLGFVSTLGTDSTIGREIDMTGPSLGRRFSRAVTLCLLAGLGVLLTAGSAPGGTAVGHETYTVTNLVSDGTIPAAHTDANLVNAWGLTATSSSPWWVANNGTGTSTLYNGDGVAQFGPTPLVVGVPNAPTGAVANPTNDFVVSSGGASGKAVFIFATEDGTIRGWNPGVPPPPLSTQTEAPVDNSAAGSV